MSFRTTTKHCEGCGKRLALNNYRDIERKRFCTNLCKWRANREHLHLPEVRAKAAQTRSERMALGLIPKPPRRPKPPSRFCSQCNRTLTRQCVGDKCRTCFNKAKANGKYIACTHCGRTLYLTSYRLQFKNNFCSHRCHAEWTKLQPSKITITNSCLQCHSRFDRFPSQGIGKFCSYKCVGAWRSENMRGKNAIAYVDGRTPLRVIIKNSAAYDEWRAAIFERDDCQCQRCDAEQRLHVHHIVPFSALLTQFKAAHPQLDLDDDKESAFLAALQFAPLWDVSNGETLCIKCHSYEHPNKLGLRRKSFRSR